MPIPGEPRSAGTGQYIRSRGSDVPRGRKMTWMMSLHRYYDDGFDSGVEPPLASTRSESRTRFAFEPSDPTYSAKSASISSRRRLSSFSRLRAASSSPRRLLSHSRASISLRRASCSPCSSSPTRPRNRSLMTSSSLTRVLSCVFKATMPSYVGGGSKWEPLIDAADGDGWRRLKDGSDGEWWKPCPSRLTPSKMC